MDEQSTSVREGVIDLLTECAISTKRTAELLFPELFSRVWTGLHEQIFDLLDNSDNPRKAIIAPRGIGKTTISNILLPSRAALLVNHRYIVPISATSTLATQQSENLKYFLTENVTIKKLFGDVKAGSSKFNQDQWVIRVGGPNGKDICVMPRGAGQQVRGQLYRGLRPDLIIADDLEDPESMDNEEIRKKKKEWFYNDCMKSVDNYARPIPWQVIVVNTMLHQDSLAADLIENPDWDVLQLEICDDDLKSKIPEWLSDEQIAELYREAENQNNVEGFYREYRNQPNVGGKHAVFPKEFFESYDEKDYNFDSDKDVDNLVLVDPAKTANPKNAESAIVGVAVNYRTNEIFVRDIIAGHFDQKELYDNIFFMVAHLRAKVIGIEVTGLNEFATYPLKNEIIRRGVFVQIEELHARGGTNEKGKVARIKQLVPFYKARLVKHNKAVSKKLEAQLMSFPAAKRWDVMDAFAYTIEILEKGERYMGPLAVSPDGELIQQEMEQYTKRQVEQEMNKIMDSYGKDDLPLTGFRLI